MLGSYVCHQFISKNSSKNMEFQAKFTFVFLALVVLWYNQFELVYGKPAEVELENGEPTNNATRVARQLYHQCNEKWGCHNGYCWAGCQAIAAISQKEWCYTTRGHSQDYQYVTCQGMGDCDACWNCAGPCTLF